MKVVGVFVRFRPLHLLISPFGFKVKAQNINK
jgi:hypothetical protein